MSSRSSDIKLDALGPRICILGPSNSGKSTLADAISRARGLPAVHLDQLHHRPRSDWQPRPAAEFLELHEAATAREAWVLDGNYMSLLPKRLARATGVIVLNVPIAVGLWRYVRRTVFERERRGGLDGRERLKWLMVHHIAVVERRNRRRQAAVLAEARLPKILLPSMRAVADFYAREDLTR